MDGNGDVQPFSSIFYVKKIGSSSSNWFPSIKKWEWRSFFPESHPSIGNHAAKSVRELAKWLGDSVPKK